MRLAVGSFGLDVAADGALTDLAHADSGGPVLARVGLGPAHRDGTVLAWHDHAVRIDEDETELSCRSGALQAQLRHSFAAGWTTRLALTNTGPDRCELDDLVLDLEPADGVTPWLISAGTEAWFAFLPAAGPVLAGRSANGWIDDLDSAGLHLGPLALEPGERRIVRLPWDWHADPAALRTRLPDWLPTRTIVIGETELALRADPDVALVVGDDSGRSGAWVEDDVELGLSLVCGEVGRTRVERRSSRGTAVVELAWAATAAEVRAEAVRAVLAGPRTRSGVVRPAGIDEALLLQRALGDGSDAGGDELVEALDLFTARAFDSDAQLDPDPWRCTYAVGEAQRLADPDFLDLAAAELAAVADEAVRQGRIPAGLGIAVARLSVARMVSGSAFTAPMDLARALLGDPRLIRDAGWWEARLATQRLTPQGSAEPDAVAELIAVGRRLGAGLPGHAAAPSPAALHAQRWTLVRLVPEAQADRLTGDWGLDPAGLAEQAEAELLLRLGRGTVGPAHRWLAVADPPG